ncbi:MAG: ATP-binding cassette domain-containing protein [Coprococcus phoceensis]
MIVSIVSGITIPFTLVIWKYLIDDMSRSIVSGNIAPVLFWLIFYFIFNYLQSVLMRIKDYQQNILSSYLNRYTSDLILKKVKDTDLKYFDSSMIYDKIRKVNEESTGRSISLLATLTNFIQSFSSLIGTITVLVSLNVGIMLLCIFICIPTLIVSMKMAVTQYEIYTKRFEGLRFIAYLKDIVTDYENIKEMKIYHVHDFFRGHILKQYDGYIQEDKKIRRSFCKKLSLTDLVEEAAILFFKIYITLKVILEKRTLGDFSLYINSIDNFRGSATTILNTIVTIFEDGLYIQNLFEFLDMKTTERIENSLSFNKNFQKIEFKNVWFRYPESEKYILKGISFTIDAKHCYSIVGLNGSGKTTIIKLLLKLLKLPTPIRCD